MHILPTMRSVVILHIHVTALGNQRRDARGEMIFNGSGSIRSCRCYWGKCLFNSLPLTVADADVNAPNWQRAFRILCSPHHSFNDNTIPFLTGGCIDNTRIDSSWLNLHDNGLLFVLFS